MRLIKFRAWDKGKEKMYKAIKEIYFTSMPGEKHSLSAIRFWSNQEGEWKHYMKSAVHLELMQYTGLKDKNVKEIYEGDIVKTFWKSMGWNGGLGIITWKPKSACFKIMNKAGDQCGINNRPEVIGNIYQNPELAP